MDAPPPDEGLAENRRVAALLREAAGLLEAQRDNPYRVGAFLKAAQTIDESPLPLRPILARDGPAGLDALPGIGSGIAAAIAEILLTGRWARLDRLRGAHDPVALFRELPGIGPELARTLHDTLHVDTLEALEALAHEGRLRDVSGIGPRRATAITAALAARLAHRRGPDRAATALEHRHHGEADADDAGRPAAAREPPVSMLLEVDREYREKAARGELPRIAPRRFNPAGDAWLPVLHTHHARWHFTALYSNTARAHELGRTHDWVVIYYDDDHHHERQHTVVTEFRGTLAGRRVVRGREAACRAHYRSGKD